MHLLIAAAGSGTRIGASCNKLLLPVAGRPLLSWTLDAAYRAKSINWIGIVGQPIDKAAILELLASSSKPVHWINGGLTRQESVRRGLAGLPPGTKHVLIHDGARCLVEASLFDRCASLLSNGKAVIAATPVTDTIKRVDVNGLIVDTPDRSKLWAAQTPQGFLVSQLKKAHQKAEDACWTVTDDASLFERLALPVNVLDAGPGNIKVTTKFDLTIAEAVLLARGAS